MKNVYDGVVTLDSTGHIEVELPAWFEAVNRDFRYQLTPIGTPAPDFISRVRSQTVVLRLPEGNQAWKYPGR